MEEKFNPITPEIVEDMPDFDEISVEMPCEKEESVDKCTDSPENGIVSEEKQEEKAEKTDDKSFYKFNPLQMAIKPFYDKAIAEDALFAKMVKEKENRKEKPKSLAECAEYILGEAFKYAQAHKQGNFGLAGMPDEDMPNLIKHYYDEDDITINKVTGAKAVVKKAEPKKAEKKAKETPKPVKNTFDISKIVTAKKQDENAPKRKVKDNLLAGFVPMERPDAENYEKEARKGSRQQAKSVEQMDLFADFFGE